MSRLPYAAVTLIAQVAEEKPRAKVEPVGEVDGLGVHRTIRFSKSAAKWLTPLLEEVGDPRVQSLNLTDDGLEVTFVATRLADDKEPFPLTDAAVVKGA